MLERYTRPHDQFDRLIYDAQGRVREDLDADFDVASKSSFLRQAVPRSGAARGDTSSAHYAASLSSDTSSHAGEDADPATYVSPFRRDLFLNGNVKRSTYTGTALVNVDAKDRKFPTVSATSRYNKSLAKQQGFKTLSDDTKRARDISFPTYLTENEVRQFQDLTEIELKEAQLKNLKDAQHVQTLEDADIVPTATDDEPVPIDSAPKVPYRGPGLSYTKSASPGNKASRPIDPPKRAQANKVESSSKPGLKDFMKDAKDVHVPVDPPKRKSASSSKSTGFSAFFKDASQSQTTVDPPKNRNGAPVIEQPNPIATPENPEEIVFSKFYKGYLSKAVYDKVRYDEGQHSKFIEEFNAEEREKYDAKKKEYQEQLAEIQAQIDEINVSIDKVKEDTANKIEVSEHELIRKIFETNSKHYVDKTNLFKETEELKLKSLQDKDAVLAKQEEIKKELEQLNSTKSDVKQDFQQWSLTLSDLSTQLDAKIFKIEQFNLRQTQIQENIDKLNEKKRNMENEIEKHEKIKKENDQVVENYENKAHLPQINEIDNNISKLLEEMAVIKQENLNEKTQLANITKKLEEERQMREETLKREAEERQREEENKLEKQRQELTKQNEELQKEHEEQVARLKKQYQKELEEARKQQEEAAAQKKNETSSIAVPENDSVYEYEHEEEVLYA